MVDWDKQKKFQALADYLKQVIAERYGNHLEWYQAYTANRFEMNTQRPTLPHFELEFTNEEHLAVAVGDGAYVPPFTGIASCSHCTLREPDGWRFDMERIGEIACRLIDVGIWIFDQHQAERKRYEKSRNG